jgi:ATP-binding protein involved in chromosome partitioning
LIMGIIVTQDDVLSALSKVQEPELHKDLVSLNMISDLQIDQNRVSFTIVLTTPACPLKSRIESEARAAVNLIPGVQSVDIKMSSVIPADGRDRGLLQLPIKNAVAIASGKGGVGKSTVAVNVAVILAQCGAKVGLLDADIYGPNIPTMMGVHHLPEAIGDKLVPAEAHGVKIMSIGFMVKPDQPLIWRSLPLSGGVIITLPQQVSQEDARRGLEMFRQLDVPVFGVVENMSYLELADGTRMDIFGTGGGEKLAKEAHTPFIGAIPLDSAVRQGGDNGLPVVLAFPESPVALALRNVAENIAARVSVAALRGRNVFTIKMIE